MVKEFVSQTTHENDDVEPLKGLPPSLSVGGVNCHHRHTQSHETTILPQNVLCVLTDSLLLVLGEMLEASSNGVPVIHLFSNLSRKSANDVNTLPPGPSSSMIPLNHDDTREVEKREEVTLVVSWRATIPLRRCVGRCQLVALDPAAAGRAAGSQVPVRRPVEVQQSRRVPPPRLLRGHFVKIFEAQIGFKEG